MINIENVVLPSAEQMKSVVMGMRNPLNSWEKSDSYMTYIVDDETLQEASFEFFMGENDLALARKLTAAGSDHGKFLRMIPVFLDITAPLYWWKEFDTYKVGTVANSCSTMHTIHKCGINSKLFSFDNMDEDAKVLTSNQVNVINSYLTMLEDLRCECKSGDETWRKLIQLLPEGFNQMRTVELNYQVLRQIYHSRRNHKLVEWKKFCEWIETLPYSELITM